MIEGHDIGGTCVNRGCVPSKALLAASGRIREMRDAAHMKALGIQVRPCFSLSWIADQPGGGLSTPLSLPPPAACRSGP